MKNEYLLRFLILGARMHGRLTGRVPNSATWPLVWGKSRRYSHDRWRERDRSFLRRDFDYTDALLFLKQSQRIGPGDIRSSSKDINQGSIPETDLAFIARHLAELGDGAALRGLHIGNFVGLSLAYLTSAMRKVHPGSIMMSIDPNIPHRGVDNPQDLVTGLMARYDLLANWLPVTGFTRHRDALFDIFNRKSGTTVFSSYYGFGAIEVLANLIKIGAQFDFALIDGNHDGAYLGGEIDLLSQLIKPGGLLFLDDLDDSWSAIDPGVREVFQSLDNTRFRRITQKGRIGVVRII